MFFSKVELKKHIKSAEVDLTSAEALREINQNMYDVLPHNSIPRFFFFFF